MARMPTNAREVETAAREYVFCCAVIIFLCSSLHFRLWSADFPKLRPYIERDFHKALRLSITTRTDTYDRRVRPMRQHTERIHVSTPATSSRSSLKELTFRGIVIGGIITLVFTAANVYLGLKVGLTFATSIPAAVISMAILRFFSDHTIQENNIVQTIASAAGTLSAVIFIT